MLVSSIIECPLNYWPEERTGSRRLGTAWLVRRCLVFPKRMTDFWDLSRLVHALHPRCKFLVLPSISVSISFRLSLLYGEAASGSLWGTAQPSGAAAFC